MTAKEELFKCLSREYCSIDKEGYNILEAVNTDDVMRALKALEAIHQCVYDMENLFFEYLEQKTEEENNESGDDFIKWNKNKEKGL